MGHSISPLVGIVKGLGSPDICIEEHNHPLQMKTPNTSICSSSLRCQVITVAIACFALLSAAYGQNKDKVDIKGSMLTDSPEGASDALAVVELDNRVCTPLEFHPDGKFKLSMPMGSTAYLRFEQPGYLDKEVLVNTANADLCKKDCRKNENLKFDVQMTPELPDKHLQYRGPVGIITFLKGSGLMKVRYDRTLTRTNEGDIIVIDQ
jgi:hypothetical protein